MQVVLMTAKELAKDPDVKIGEHKIRSMAKEYKDFPQVRVGVRRFFIKEEVLEWIRRYSIQGIKL